MDYTAIYVNTFTSLLEVVRVMLPYIIIAIIIMIIKSRTSKKNKNKGYNKEYNRKQNKEITPAIDKTDYEQTEYFKETGTTYEEMIMDKGKAGEYAAFRELQLIYGEKKFLYNVYVPDPDNNTKKTEIDIVMLHEKGIFVIECKNYNGWIYGDEASEKWCQVFKNKKKYFFYNPIKQNYRHIQQLRKHIGEDKEIYSIIVFGDGATLKDITNSNNNLKIVNKRELRKTVVEIIGKKQPILNKDEIEKIYSNFKQMQW